MSTPTSKRKIFFSISAILIVIGIVFLFIKGLNLGIDFTGGTTFQFKLTDTKYSPQVENDIKALVKEHTGVAAADCVVQQVGDDEVSVRTKKLENTQSDALKKALIEKYKFDAKTLEFETVSGTVSGRLLGDSLKAIALAVVLMLIYIWFRFDIQSGTSAVVALVHDVLIMLGFYAVFGFTVNTSFIAAILTIVGYSINATIVVFDRVRENLQLHKGSKFGDLVNLSVNQTLSRTLITSLTTFIVVFIMWLFGGPEISDFVFVMMWGIILGTYSSVCLSAPFVEWQLRRKAAKNGGR